MAKAAQKVAFLKSLAKVRLFLDIILTSALISSSATTATVATAAAAISAAAATAAVATAAAATAVAAAIIAAGAAASSSTAITAAVAAFTAIASALAAIIAAAGSFLFSKAYIGRKVAFAKHFSFADPNLDTDFAVNGLRFSERIIDIGAERMQWGTSFFVFFGARHFSAAQATRDAHLDAFGACAHRRLDRHLDSAAIINTGFDLLGDRFPYDIRIEFGFANLNNIDLHVFAREFFQLLADAVYFLACLADNNTGAGGVYRHRDALERTLDNHAGNAAFLDTRIEVGADIFIFHYL